MKTLYFRHNEDDNIIILCIMHNHNKFDRVFVALSLAIFILCVSLLSAWSLIAVSLSLSGTLTREMAIWRKHFTFSQSFLVAC